MGSSGSKLKRISLKQRRAILNNEVSDNSVNEAQKSRIENFSVPNSPREHQTVRKKSTKMTTENNKKTIKIDVTKTVPLKKKKTRESVVLITKKRKATQILYKKPEMTDSIICSQKKIHNVTNSRMSLIIHGDRKIKSKIVPSKPSNHVTSLSFFTSSIANKNFKQKDLSMLSKKAREMGVPMKINPIKIKNKNSCKFN